MDIFEDNIIQVLKHDNEKLLRTFLERLIEGDRADALRKITDFITKIEGKQRLRILEVLIEDGGVDLIPIFVETIRRERNLLFAKSVLFLYANFEHREALEAILPLEATLQGELGAAFQRVAGKLKARFRQDFYMNEFRENHRNHKRIKHAAEMMIKEPHPVYVPFLEEIILGEFAVYRELGIEVLHHLGEESSIAALFGLLEVMLGERKRVDGLVDFLLRPKKIKKLADFLEGLGRAMSWEEGRGKGFEEEVRQENVHGCLEAVKQSLNLVSTVMWHDTELFLEATLKGKPTDEVMRRRLEQAAKSWVDHQREQMEHLFAALGEVGNRAGVADLVQRADASLADADPFKPGCMAALLGGYRSNDAREQLLTYLRTGGDSRFIEKVLAALVSYEVETIPDEVLNLAADPGDAGVRRLAMELLAKWRVDADALVKLLHHESLGVRADAAQLIADNNIAHGHPLLIEALTGNAPASLIEIFIRALAAFPGEQTGQAIRAFLFPPHPYPIRNAALEILFEAGGEERFSMIASALAEYPDKRKSETVASLLKLLEPLEPGQHPSDMLQQIDFFKEILADEKQDRMRMQVCTVLERADWQDAEDFGTWLSTLNQALDQLESIRKYDEKKKLRLLIHRIRSFKESDDKRKAEAEQEQREAAKKLSVLLDKLEKATHHDQVRAIRQLNLLCKPEMFEQEPEELERFEKTILEFFDAHEGAPEYLKPAISVAAKSHLPALEERIRRYLDSEDEVLSKFARTALHLKETGENQHIHKLFVLDDSVLFTKALQRFLVKAGFEVVVANDPMDGLNLLQEDHCEMMILDYHMPKMDGVTFLTAARQKKLAPKHSLFITSTRNQEDVQRIIQAGSNGILLKPFPLEQLVRKIREVE